jgi:hypothetical protein
MAKLIKASTARKRAESVDKAELRLASIAEYIAHTAARGKYECSVGVTNEDEQYIVDALVKAGYTVRYTDLEFLLNTFALDDPGPKNWFQRLLTKLFDATKEDIVEVRGEPDYEEISISWYPPVDPSEIEIIDSI